MFPKPMQDPCTQCERTAVCQSAETYKCPAFHEAFVSAWDDTIAFLRQQLGLPPLEVTHGS